jgi:hypothetical protein
MTISDLTVTVSLTLGTVIWYVSASLSLALRQVWQSVALHKVA